jgi:hypothetical protein
MVITVKFWKINKNQYTPQKTFEKIQVIQPLNPEAKKATKIGFCMDLQNRENF